ncbi:MAG: metallophosphatase family protein [Acetatifactor sp.]|nr:metallophosphatase family protein [Acetatifactor sp.]
MKLGILADSHSNACALQVCIDAMLKEGCEEFLLLGDFVSDTSQTRETLDILYDLMKRFPCHILRGNREEYFIEQRLVRRGEAKGEVWLRNSASGNLLYNLEHLTEEDIDFFESLPISFVYEKEGYPSITCCHGAPDTTRHLLQLEAEDTKEILDDLSTDYLIAAHTHNQGVMEYQGKVYCNPGSLGIAIGAPGLAQCAIFESAERDGKIVWIPNLLNLPYDRDGVVEMIFESGLADCAPWFINNNLHILYTGIDLTPDIVNHAKRFQEEATGEPAIWPRIEEQYFAKAGAFLGIPDYVGTHRHDKK